MIIPIVTNSSSGVTYFTNDKSIDSYIIVTNDLGHIEVFKKGSIQFFTTKTLFACTLESEAMTYINQNGFYLSNSSNLDEDLKSLFEL